MKKLIITSIFALLPCMPLGAHLDCIEQSNHLTQKFDSKEYHYVKTCDCPCGEKYKTLPGVGMCTECKHYRTPRPFLTMVHTDPVTFIDVKALKRKARRVR